MRTMHRPLRALIAALAILAVTACAPQPAPLQTVRPVRLMSVADGNELSSQVFSGEVRARHESTLGFRVPGKVIRRLVDIGDRVQTGTVLAQIDATDYEHARDSLAAQLGAARAEHSFARDELERHRELAEQKLISPAELDRRDTALQVAAGRLRSLESQLAQAADQLGYARLVADREGVVTAVNVEAGQVVAAGTPVITVARQSEREILIRLPEENLADIRKGQALEVSFVARPAERVEGRVREISPVADPGSRTYAVRVSLPDAPAWVAFGMTASVAMQASGAFQMALPLAAVFEPQSAPKTGPRVWVFDDASSTVKSIPVSLGRPLEGERIEVRGLEAGTKVVVAGARSLREGQKVRALGDEAPVQARIRSSE